MKMISLYLAIGITIAAIIFVIVYWLIFQPLDKIPDDPIKLAKNDNMTTGTRGDLVLILTTEKLSYKAGAIIPIHVSLTNVGQNTLTMWNSRETLLQVALVKQVNGVIENTVAIKTDMGQGCSSPPTERTITIEPNESYKINFELEAPDVNSQSEFHITGQALGFVEPWDRTKYGDVGPGLRCHLLLRTDSLPIDILK